MAKGNALGIVIKIKDRDNPQPIMIIKIKKKGEKMIPEKKFENIRDPEIWTPIIDPRIRNIYEISNYGRVKNQKGKLLSAHIDKDGYLKYKLQGIDGKKYGFFAHRLVAIHFIENPERKPEINHKHVDRENKNYIGIVDKQDNYYENLEWVTRKENSLHSKEHRLQSVRSCEAAANAKVDNDTVHYICSLLELGYTNVEIRRKFGIPKENKKLDEQYRGLIKHIKSRKHWIEISSMYKF